MKEIEYWVDLDEKLHSDADLDFTAEQQDRIDEIEIAAFDFCKLLVEDENLDWNISFIGEVADMAANIMAEHGFKVRYPFIVHDGDGEHIEEYITKENYNK